ncbi:MAG TPA: glycosyltransferase family 39 protein, partial [Pyrinomonadaceae bacterium]|nr:glycosyltransferase family 39 protein [Pyrinomonadaceae bacterium]
MSCRKGWGLRINRKQLATLFTLLLITISVRVLTLQFMRAHLNDPSWFQVGSYAKFDRQARDILDGRQRLFWIDDPGRTDLAQYPPAFPALVALIYSLSAEHSAYSVQIVLWIADLILSLLLIMGIAFSAFGWRAAIASGFLVGLSPLLALYAAYPSADVPATWFVLGGNWLLLLAAQRKDATLALASGVMLGIACWLRVNPLYLCVGWAIALLLVRTTWPQRLKMSGAVLLGTIVVIAPIVVRNYLVFPDFTPTGGTIGTNLWEGLGETELGRSNGFMLGDEKMLERERAKMNLPPDVQADVQWPDGIRRDRERTREAMAFIRQHKIWYVGVMAGRMWGMLKVAGRPVPYCGTSGINVTSRKCLSPQWQGGVVAGAVNLLGMIQSVVRYLFLPLAVFGIYVAARRDWRLTCLLLVTVVYYLVPGTVAHTEIRYVLPMHGLLIVFASTAMDRIFSRRFSRMKTDSNPLPREMMEHTYPILFRVEQSHWWYIGRRKIIAGFVEDICRRVTDRRPRILDVGCGTGANLLLLS